LKKNSFKTSIINECATFFYEKDFEKQLDSKCNLICFNNGVYDLDNELFREGTPDDYMKLTTGYDYLDFSESHPLILEILDFFKKIHTNKCKREYILTFIASCLHGEIVDQKCIFWTGSGSNGKSSEIDLIKHAFGEYFDTLPVSVITQKRAGSSQATPELADKRGKRFIVMNESEENEKIYVGTFKDITGGSDIYSRPLYKDPFTYKPQFKIVLCCNILPNITANDNGTWRRIRVVLHDSEFVDELKATSQDQNKFLKDKHLMAKLQQYKQAFMWLLIHMYYKKYKIQGLEEPKEVTSYTDKYKQDSDVFLEFNRDHIVTSSMDTYETMVTLYDEFKNWFKTSHPNSKVPEKKTLVNYLQTNKYTVDRGKIYGIKIQKSCN
jgi:P4 family phage/plasmid primase-like protien